MRRKPADRRTLQQVLFFVCALAASLACYALQLETLGGTLLLSTILVFAIQFLRSGALSPLRLTHRNPRTIRNVMRLELAKTFGCAGLAVDALGLGNRVMRTFLLHDPLSFTLLFTICWLLALAALLFLARWAAASLSVTRR